MKVKLIALSTIFIFLLSCKNDSIQTDTKLKQDEYLLNIENDNYRIKLKEIDKNRLTNLNASHSTNPFLAIRAVSISVGSLLNILANVDKDSLILEGVDFNERYFNVLVEQHIPNNKNDSIIKGKIFKALNLVLEYKTYNVDTVYISLKNQPNLMKNTNRYISDSLKIKYSFSQDSIKFEDFNLDNKLSKSNIENLNVIMLIIESSENSNIGLIKNDNGSMKTNLGYEFEYISKSNTIQIQKPSVRRKSLVEI